MGSGDLTYEYINGADNGMRKNGKQKAEQNLNSIQDILNYQKATEGFSNLQGHVGQQRLYGVNAGLEQFRSGVKSLMNKEGKYAPQNDTQMMSGLIRENLQDTGPTLSQWLGGGSLWYDYEHWHQGFPGKTRWQRVPRTLAPLMPGKK